MVKKMSQKQTKKTNLELKKPSELCQVLFYSDFNKKDYAYLTSLQIDLVSTIFYLISDVMNKQKLEESDIFEWSSINHFEINLQTIAEMIGKYENGYYEPIVQNLQELSKVQVLTNTLHKNKTTEFSLFHLIRKISWLKDKQTTNRRVKIWIEPELLTLFHNVNKMHSSFYLQIQYSLGSKYSKLLYELLKDYSNLNEFVIDFSILKALLNVDNKDNPSIDNWSIFNRDILKRAVKEVSEKSDINVVYEPIKNIIDGKKQVDKIKFTIIKQKSKLIDYDLNPALKEYITDTLVVSSESKTDDYDPLELKLIELARKKMEKAKVFGTVVQNEQKYIQAIVEQLKRDDIDIEGMVEMDKILNSVKKQFQPNKINSINQLIILDYYDPKYPLVTLSHEYLLYSPIDRVNITQTIEDTINKINDFKDKGGQFKLIQTPEYVDELEISYL